MKNLIMNIVLVCILISIPMKAFAYLDPGTGSYIVQILLASLFGVLFAVKLFWTNIKLFFMKIFRGVSKDKDISSEKSKNN